MVKAVVTFTMCVWEPRGVHWVSLSTTSTIPHKHSLTVCSCSPGTPGTGSCPLTKRGCAAAERGMCNMTEICSRTPVHIRHRESWRDVEKQWRFIGPSLCRYCLLHSKQGFLRFPELCVLLKVVSGTCWMRLMRLSRQIWDLCIHRVQSEWFQSEHIPAPGHRWGLVRKHALG